MTQMLVANLAPLMFAALVILLLLGYPVAFSLAANGLLFGLLAIHLDLLKPELLQALPERVFGIMRNDTLLAIPFFTFMGLILERSGMAEDLLETIGQMFGPVRGGLAYAVVFVGALLAATTGVVAASVISMGLISLPIMLRYGYDRRLAAGVITASGTLAQIIPPSLVLIVMADQLGRSVGDMYQGAFIPGLALAALYAGFVFVMTIVRPASAPALPPEALTMREDGGGAGYGSLVVLIVLAAAGGYLLTYAMHPIWAAGLAGLVVYAVALADRFLRFGLLSRLAQQVVIVMMPPLALIFLVLGTIFVGIATPTEGGAMGATGALILALVKRRLSWGLLRQAMDSTARLSSFVVFILIGSSVFTLTFRGVNGDLWVENLLTSLPGGQIGFLIVVNATVFFLAFFLDFFELAFIVIPLLRPVADKLGIDLIWFGVLLGVNMQTSFLHPPFGFALFYFRSVAPMRETIDRVTGRLMAPVTTAQIYWGSVPFVVMQLLMVAAIIAFPRMVLASLDKASDVNPNSIQIEVPQTAPGEIPQIEFK
ncbi:MAG TPA: TRAP transporter large permease subunit [Stellaceae bacterium]|jgi:TRAP-type mannitol/chloroaromatic compound transport system permease large subunit|nr:TRAP transporter large permease subunit [Stellaceae bacterium]